MMLISVLFALNCNYGTVGSDSTFGIYITPQFFDAYMNLTLKVFTVCNGATKMTPIQLVSSNYMVAQSTTCNGLSSVMMSVGVSMKFTCSQIPSKIFALGGENANNIYVGQNDDFNRLDCGKVATIGERLSLPSAQLAILKSLPSNCCGKVGVKCTNEKTVSYIDWSAYALNGYLDMAIYINLFYTVSFKFGILKGFFISGNIAFRGWQNNQYCTNTGAGKVVCSSDTLGTAQTFQIAPVSVNSVYTLKSTLNNKFCTVGTGGLVCNKASASNNEYFNIISLGNSPVDGRPKIAIKSRYTGQYCTNESTDTIQCKSDDILTWEQFYYETI
eukprot:NODE_574_length_5874_cov_0.812294.p2 type:complete len:330 gc:universal NODE_574_length_5874_cov_0.812294:707-1696(+)